MAGDTLELSIKHPTVGSKTFAVQSDQSITVDVGGYTKTRQMNGNLTGHPKLAAKMWEIAGLQLEFVAENGDIEFLQAVANAPDDAIITWQHIDGYIYNGSGSIEGDIKGDSNTGYVPITLTGAGILEQL